MFIVLFLTSKRLRVVPSIGVKLIDMQRKSYWRTNQKGHFYFVTVLRKSISFQSALGNRVSVS